MELERKTKPRRRRKVLLIELRSAVVRHIEQILLVDLVEQIFLLNFLLLTIEFFSDFVQLFFLFDRNLDIAVLERLNK